MTSIECWSVYASAAARSASATAASSQEDTSAAMARDDVLQPGDRGRGELAAAGRRDLAERARRLSVAAARVSGEIASTISIPAPNSSSM